MANAGGKPPGALPSTNSVQCLSLGLTPPYVNTVLVSLGYWYAELRSVAAGLPGLIPFSFLSSLLRMTAVLKKHAL